MQQLSSQEKAALNSRPLLQLFLQQQQKYFARAYVRLLFLKQRPS